MLTITNLILRASMTICLISLTACAGSGQWVSISTISHSARYQRDCVGPNAQYRSTDRECQTPQEPNVQVGQVQRVDRRSTWRDREDIMMWCRQRPNIRDERCEGLPRDLADR